MENNYNVISLLKQALNFYADKNNYQDKNNINSIPKIELDCGNHARFTLEQVNKIENLIYNAEDEFVKNLSKNIENNDSLLNLIENYKNLNLDTYDNSI